MTKQPNIRRSMLNVRSLDDAADIPVIDEIDVRFIHPNPNQPRKTFDEETLKGLASSIEQKGLLQPILIKPMAEAAHGYILVAGERRWRAHQLLERPTILAIITHGDVDEIAIIENLQRENLNPIEEADGIARLKETHRYTDEVLAKTLGKSRSMVTEMLGIARLPETIRAECRPADMTISRSTLFELVRLGNEKEQLSLWEQIKAGGMTRQAIRATKEKTKIKRHTLNQDVALVAGRKFLKELEALSPASIEEDTRLRLHDLRRALITRLD